MMSIGYCDVTMYLRLVVITTFAWALSGCQMSPADQSTLLAMPQNEVESMSANQRSTYVSTANTSASKRYYAQFFSRTQEADSLRITISGGTAALAPQYQPGRYRPVVTQLAANKCEMVSLQSLTASDQVASLSLCYLNDKLYVDASSTNSQYPMGSMIIPISHRFVAEQRFCQLRTKGNAKLSDACMLVQQNGRASVSNKPVQQVNRAPKNPAFSPSPRAAHDAEPQTTSSTSSVVDAANAQS